MYTFISGATGGLGKAFAFLCAEKGYDLFLTGRSDARLAALKSDILAKYPDAKVEYFPCQLTESSSRQEMLDFIDLKGLKFDRILNVAGVDNQRAFTDYPPEKVVFQIRVNCEATLALTHALLARREPRVAVA